MTPSEIALVMDLDIDSVSIRASDQGVDRRSTTATHVAHPMTQEPRTTRTMHMRHSRTPSLVSCTGSGDEDDDDEDEEILIDHHAHDHHDHANDHPYARQRTLNTLILDQTSDPRPRLKRTISLPIPLTPTLYHRPATTRAHGESNEGSVETGQSGVDSEGSGMKVTLKGMSGLNISSVSSSTSSSRPLMAVTETQEGAQYIHHRRTVSTSDINVNVKDRQAGSNRLYRFGGKEFVPLRMEAFEVRPREGEGMVKIVREGEVEEEDRDVEMKMDVITPKPNLPNFPTSLIERRLVSSALPVPPKSLTQTGGRQPGSGRTSRIRAISPYSHHHQPRPSFKHDPSARNGLGAIAPSLIFRRTHRKSTSLGVTDGEIPPSSLTPSTSIGPYRPEGGEPNRKLILVGPAICRHLQNGGSVRVKDFSGAVVGWMH